MVARSGDGYYRLAMPAEPTLGEMLAAAAAGDQPAWDTLVQRFAPLVWAVARAHGLDRVEAADLSQTVWLRLVEQLGRIREPEALPGWLRSTAHHECLRIRRRTREAPVDWQALSGIPDDAATDAAALADERDTVIATALTRLSQKCQSLLRVFAFSPDAAYAEIAGALGMPIGSIGPTRARCLGHLRTRLESVGYLAPSR